MTEQVRKGLQKIIDDLERMPQLKEIKERDKELYCAIRKTGGIQVWAKRMGYRYGTLIKCRHCGCTVMATGGRVYCEREECLRSRGITPKKDVKIRPYTSTTDLLIKVDIRKGWPLDKVARVNAEALNRDYNDVLKRTKKLARTL